MSNTRAEFFRASNGRDMVRVSIIGDPSIFEGRVEPKHVQQFPREWAAYEAGRPAEEPTGTPVTDVPGVSDEMARAWKLKGVRTAEELAALSDLSAKGLGMGGITAREGAKNLLAARRVTALEAALAAKNAPLHQQQPPLSPLIHTNDTGRTDNGSDEQGGDGSDADGETSDDKASTGEEASRGEEGQAEALPRRGQGRSRKVQP